jgi:hypothetical protein
MLLEEHEIWYLVEKQVALAAYAALSVGYGRKMTKAK